MNKVFFFFLPFDFLDLAKGKDVKKNDFFGAKAVNPPSQLDRDPSTMNLVIINARNTIAGVDAVGADATTPSQQSPQSQQPQNNPVEQPTGCRTGDDASEGR